MTRRDLINRIVDNVAQRGAASGEMACSPALANIFRAALAEEDTNAVAKGVEPLDPAKVLIGIMKNMRAAMTEVRDELDGMDGKGKYR